MNFISEYFIKYLSYIKRLWSLIALGIKPRPESIPVRLFARAYLYTVITAGTLGRGWGDVCKPISGARRTVQMGPFSSDVDTMLSFLVTGTMHFSDCGRSRIK